MANERFTDEELKQIKKLEDFLKEAFCIDGRCDYIEDVTIKSDLKIFKSAMFALGDTKRGMFYVTLSK